MLKDGLINDDEYIIMESLSTADESSIVSVADVSGAEGGAQVRTEADPQPALSPDPKPPEPPGPSMYTWWYYIYLNINLEIHKIYFTLTYFSPGTNISRDTAIETTAISYLGVSYPRFPDGELSLDENNNMMFNGKLLYRNGSTQWAMEQNALYAKRFYYTNDFCIPSFAGARWIANTAPDYFGDYQSGTVHDFNLDFICDGNTYTRMRYKAISGRLPMPDGSFISTAIPHLWYHTSYTTTLVEQQQEYAESLHWFDEKYRTVILTGGADLNNIVAMTWLIESGTLTFNYKAVVNLTASSKWQSLAEGPHNIQIRSLASGHTESALTPSLQVIRTDGYRIQSDLAHTAVLPPATTVTYAAQTVTIHFVADPGYSLPETISVLNANYVWDKATGTLSLFNATDIVKIVITSTYIPVTYTINSTPSINIDGIEDIDIIANNIEFKRIYVSKASSGYSARLVLYSKSTGAASIIYDSKQGWQLGTVYKKLTFLQQPSDVLQDWLNNNAVRQ